MIHDDKRRPVALNLAPSRNRSNGSVSSTSTSSTTSSLAKPPRTPRFAEATAVHSPVEPKKLPFSERSMVAQSQPGDVGFGYIGGGQRESVAMPMTPRSPLKSAMKVPGTPGKGFSNPMSPTFREEEMLEKREKTTEKDQKRDLKIKTRVRMAKFALRSVSFSCSLIIMAMISSSFAIFNATRALPSMNGLPPWADNTNAWPQKVVLGCACFSLLLCIIVFVGYCRGGHQRAEKVGVYYTMFAVGWFIFSMVMWAVAAGVLQHSRNNTSNKDMWGWACLENHRSELFREKVDYELVCRLQNWTMICIIIELVIEIISIILYSIVFYRYWSKRKLHKSMDMRDKARSDLYLAQLRSQSAPNTPGFGPKSPAFSQYALSPRFPPTTYQNLGEINEKDASPFTPGGKRLVIPESQFTPKEGGFKLQPAPPKANPATPITPKGGFASPSTESAPSSRINDPAPMAAGEQQYEAVPIPGAYAGQAVKSPPPTQTSFSR